jgi:hypothetical protein
MMSEHMRFIMPSDSDEEEEQHKVKFGKVIYIQIPNDRADREARCGTWVIDRARFHQRIREIDKRVGWIFSARHLDIIYNSRHAV